MSDLLLRPLDGQDWAEFSALRLVALRTEPGVFFASYDQEAPRTENEWRAILDGRDQCVFGLYDAEKLIGFTGVFISSEDPTRSTALLAMTYLSPEYRGAGLARRYYEARLEWARARGLKRAVTGHRGSNQASKRTMVRFGFECTGSRPRVWPDGTVDDDVDYELQL